MADPNPYAAYANMALSGIGMIGGIFGGIQGMNRLGDVIRARNDAAAMVRDYIGQNVMPAGAAWGSMYQPSYGGLMDFAYGFSAGGFNVDPLRMGFINTQGRLDDFYNSLGNYSQPNYNNPFLIIITCPKCSATKAEWIMGWIRRLICSILAAGIPVCRGFMIPLWAC